MKAALHSPIVREAAGILVAAVCLGFAYDAVSPLGVRASGRAAACATAAAAVAVALPQTPAAAPEAAAPPGMGWPRKINLRGGMKRTNKNFDRNG